MTMTAAFLLKNPPASRLQTGKIPVFNKATTRHQFTPSEVLRTPAFYLLWLGFGLGSTAGLMVISQLIPFANSQGISNAALATLGLVVGAFGNVSGRVLSGWLSDIMGRLNAMRAVLAIGCVAMPALYWVGAHLAALYVLIYFVYFSYGAQASVIPSTVADFWGPRHAGANYGALFTAWGFWGVFFLTIGGVLFDRYRNYGAAFSSAAGLALVAFLCANRQAAGVSGTPELGLHSNAVSRMLPFSLKTRNRNRRRVQKRNENQWQNPGNRRLVEETI